MRRSSPLSSSLARLGVAATAAFALAPAIAQTIVIAPSAPPPMRQEVLPPARGGYVWDPGHWVARGPQWRWVEGHWAA